MAGQQAVEQGQQGMQVSPEEQQMMMEQQAVQGQPQQALAEGGHLYDGDTEPTQQMYNSYAANSNYSLPGNGISGLPLNGMYKDWATFTYGDNVPLWVNGDYIPEYADAVRNQGNSGFYKWLNSDEGKNFLKEWWNKRNAPNFYSRNSEHYVPTLQQLIGTKGDPGLMFDKNYGDAHVFGARAFAKYKES